MTRSHASFALTLVASATFAFGGHAHGATARPSAPLSAQEWMSLKGADGPGLSPDGRTVAFHVRTPDWASDRFDDELWLAPAGAGEPRQITNAAGSSSNPRWSPDSKRLAFLSTRTGASQVFAVSPPDTAPSQLTRAAGGVDDFRWSPDGRWLAYTSSTSLPSPAEPDEFHIVGNDARSSTSLWIMDASGGTPPVELTDPAAFAVDDIAWAPDSRRIAFSAKAVGAPYPFSTYDIYVVRVEDKAVTHVVDTPGPDYFPVWSPDGKQLAHVTYSKEPFFTHSLGMLAVVPAEGGAPRILTGSFDEQPTPLAWTRHGILFSARQRTYQHLFRLDPATGAIQRLTGPLETVNVSFSFDRDATHMAFVRGDARRYHDLFVGEVARPEKARQITRMDDQIRRWRIASREVVGWKSRDGTPIEGILVKPSDFDSTRKYPLVVIVHGGPLDIDQATITRDLLYPAELYTSRGALVLRPNYRGSVGYGARFRAALAGHLGIPQYEDVVSGIDAIAAKGYVDTDRLGLMGWSAGGYVAAVATTYGDRFKAVSMGAGVSDCVPFYSAGAGIELPPDATSPLPWIDLEYYRRSTPLTYSMRAHTPTLIQHGQNDPVSPIVSARAMYRALRDRGVPTKMIVYNGAGHLPNGLRQTRALVEHNLEWFGHWLWGEPLSDALR